MTAHDTGNQTAEIVADLLSPATLEDPYPLYARLRRLGPVQRTPAGFCLVTRYDHCSALLHHPALRKDPEAGLRLRGFPDWTDHLALRAMFLSMLFRNPPDHTRLRRLVSKAFTARRIAELEPAVRALTAGLLDDMAALAADGETVDLMEALAFPLPVAVIGELLGVPPADRAQFQTLVRAFSLVLELAVSADMVADADEAARRMEDYFRDLVAERRRRPAGDLVSALAAAEDAGDRLSHEELLVMLGLLLAAGFETTTNLVGNGMMALLRQPDQLARWRLEPGLTDTAVEELLRFDGPVQLTGRSAPEPVPVGDDRLEPGELVLLLLGAANRDPARFPDPDRLRLDRPDNRPLSFGGGIHYCLGAALARLEARVAFPALLARFASIELAGPAVRRPSLSLRGFLQLPLALVPAP
jgi:cytochrome P450